jgi:hypothetical protein
MTDTVTERLRKKYAEDFDRLFEKELAQPIEQIINRAEMNKPLSFTATVPLAKDTVIALREHSILQQLKQHYIDTGIANATKFIHEGVNNGTRT